MAYWPIRRVWRIQFGEYLTVPYTVAIPAILAVMVLPLLLGLPWAIQRALETE